MAWSRIIKETARKVGISDKAKWHHYSLRHGSATEATKFLTDSKLKVLYGWTMNSSMTSIYVHLSSKDIESKLEQIYSGRLVEPPKPEFSTTICPKCTFKNSPGQNYCGRRSTPLSYAELAKSAVEEQALRNKVNELKKIISNRLMPPNEGVQQFPL